jgi:RNA polymerase sigma-70 factor (ECF subfamily)
MSPTNHASPVSPASPDLTASPVAAVGAASPALRALHALLASADRRARLLRVAARVAGQEAEDALHDGIVQALASPSAFRGEASIGTWMHRVVVNAALMRLRRGRNQAHLVERAHAQADEGASATGGLAEPVDPAAVDPVDEFDRRRQLAQVRAAIDGLQPLHREALLGYVLAERPTNDVAEELSIAPTALRTRAARARRALREQLEARAA